MICLLTEYESTSKIPLEAETIHMFKSSYGTKKKWIIDHFEHIEPRKTTDEQLIEFFDFHQYV